jgi:DNA-directed RNA polymerase specialized sigma24 family protein
MSLGDQIARNLPYLRRYARALTGSQATGDAFVRATLEAALADSELKESLEGGRVPLYRAFNKVWSSAYMEVPEAVGDNTHENAAQDRLKSVTPLNRQALLLTTLEDFSSDQAGEIMDMSAEDIERFRKSTASRRPAC